jgi:dTDP-4-dehydrorhamnose 3,5-epimerase-like enzyme
MNTIIGFDLHKGVGGSLISLEGNSNIPFEIRRVFYIYGVPPDVQRGVHATRATEEVIICLKGTCKCVLDDGTVKQETVLDNPQKGLYIPHLTWRELYDFSPDCILLVLANSYYSEMDHIRNYDGFLDMKRQQLGPEQKRDN